MSSSFISLTDWNPLTIWFNNECYIRFAVIEYEDTSRPQGKQQWADNKYRHLVNNSIGKKSKDFAKTFTVEEVNEVVEGYMWSLEKFKKVRKIIWTYSVHFQFQVSLKKCVHYFKPVVDLCNRKRLMGTIIAK